MKKLMLSVMGAAVLALAGCGESRAPEQDVGPSPDFPADVQGARYSVRLRGENNPGYASALVQVRRLSVTTGEGQPLPVRLKSRQPLELTQADQSHLVGLFVVPEGVERVRVEVEFDDFGGWERGASGGVIDTRVAPLRFESPVAYLSERGHAVVHLNLAHSLRAEGDARLLLPALDVRY